MGRKKKKNRVVVETQKGVVIRSTGARCKVRTEKGEIFDCAVRGKFRIQGFKRTSPVAVGDEVELSVPDENSELGRVRKILPRKNYILRRAVGEVHKVHILAANVDQAILLFTLSHPTTSPGFVDRFLTITEAYDIPAQIIMNKIDLIEDEEDRLFLNYYTNLYRSLGYPVHHVSALDEQYQPFLSDLLTDKISFIGGHSGSGKSTLINLLDPNLNIRTGDISSYSKKGVHTTTFAEMHPLADGGYIIDSPGIRELGITDFQKTELSHFFPEMKSRLQACKFNDCTHTNEPQCAIKEAIEAEEIAEIRYMSYLSILEDIAEEEGRKY